jgi:hypothetical protein
LTRLQLSQVLLSLTNSFEALIAWGLLKSVKFPDVSTADKSILAGVRMLNNITETYFNDPGIDQVNKTLLLSPAAMRVATASCAFARKPQKKGSTWRRRRYNSSRRPVQPLPVPSAPGHLVRHEPDACFYASSGGISGALQAVHSW